MKTSRTASIRAAIIEAEADSFADDLLEVVYGSPATAGSDEPGDDGDWADANPATGLDDDADYPAVDNVSKADREWAARELNVEGGWPTDGPDGSAIELFTSSGLDRFFDELAEDREAERFYLESCGAW